MVDAGSIAMGNGKTDKMLVREDDEPWLGVQLVGADHAHLAKAAEMLNDRHFDVLDFNLGCPAPKVVKKGEGAKLAENPEAAIRAFEILPRKSRFPVTAKIRILSETDPAPTIRLATLLRDAGAKAITIHGRVRRNFYSGPVFSDIIAAAREALPGIRVIANGGVVDADTCRELRESSGCDSVMLARGAMGNPWIFDEIAGGAEWSPPTYAEFADEIFSHVRDMAEFHGLELGLKIARKIILDYMRGRGFARILKTKVIEIATIDDLRRFTDELRKGPTGRYKVWLDSNPQAPRRLRP
jgi:nifR3 family TIM-barrel protein